MYLPPIHTDEVGGVYCLIFDLHVDIPADARGLCRTICIGTVLMFFLFFTMNCIACGLSSTQSILHVRIETRKTRVSFEQHIQRTIQQVFFDNSRKKSMFFFITDVTDFRTKKLWRLNYLMSYVPTLLHRLSFSLSFLQYLFCNKIHHHIVKYARYSKSTLFYLSKCILYKITSSTTKQWYYR